MMKLSRRLTLGLACQSLAACCFPRWGRAAEISEAEFARLHAELLPQERAVWQTIPWKIDLLDAQNLAAREHKPIFIWAMDGHPLGCT